MFTGSAEKIFYGSPTTVLNNAYLVLSATATTNRFIIDTAYHNQQFALMNSDASTTYFTFLSSITSGLVTPTAGLACNRSTIDTAYHNTQMAYINADRTSTLFTFLSTTSSGTFRQTNNNYDSTGPEERRKWQYFG
jgi:hypothetical protein